MNYYIFSADLLNKFSQLTPWVQAVVILGLVAVALAPFCCVAYWLRSSKQSGSQ